MTGFLAALRRLLSGGARAPAAPATSHHRQEGAASAARVTSGGALTNWAVGRPVAVSMIFVCLFVTGLVGGQRLSLEFLPDIEWPALWIQIPYRNAMPEDVERRIVRPAEDALATLTGISSMRATADSDGASIFMRFGWDTDLSHKSLEVRDRLDATRPRFPEDIDAIIVRRFEAGSLPVLSLRFSAERDLSAAYPVLERFFVRGIERLPGVARVELFGVTPQQVLIRLSAERLAAYDIDINGLSEQMRRANFQRAGGYVDQVGLRYRVRLDGQFRDLRDVGDKIIRADGLRLADVADIIQAEPPPDRGRRLDGRAAVGINVFKSTNANLVDVADAVTAELAVIRQATELADLNILTTFNAADDVRSSLDDLLRAGMWGALFALLVLYVFVREWRMTALVTAAVPLSLTITLGVMYFAGFTLNVLTLTGLMLSIGMLVDNAVVVSESVHRERVAGADARSATLAGTSRVALAVIAGTATSAIVFLPNIFGEQNNVTIYLAHVAVTISVSLAASLAVALLLIPQLTARLPAPQPPRLPRWIRRLPEHYAGALDWSLRHRGWSMLLLVAFVASVMLPLRWVPVELFPQEESEQMQLRYNLHSSYALATVGDSVARVEAYLLENRERFEIASVYSEYRTDRADTTIRLLPSDQRRQSPRFIREQIAEGLPDITIGRLGFDIARIGQADRLAVQLYGDSAEALIELSNAVAPVLLSLPEVATVQAPDLTGAEELRVRVDRDRAQNFGLSAQQVAQLVADALRGTELRPLRTVTGELDTILELRAQDRVDINALRQLPLSGADGERLTLSQVASLETGGAPGRITRRDRRTSVELEFETASGTTPGEARTAITQTLDNWRFPSGGGWAFGTAFDREAQAMRIMLTNLLLALALIYLVMAALFESWLAPTAIISSVGFAVIGVFWFFAATGTSFTVMALIGVLILMGIVVNNGIVLVDLVQRLRREGVPRSEALRRAGRDRLRPIVMTALTTVLGMLPLALGDVAIGGDGPPYYPMARAVVGGLLTATVVSLLALPLLYSLLDDLARWCRGTVMLALPQRG